MSFFENVLLGKIFYNEWIYKLNTIINIKMKQLKSSSGKLFSYQTSYLVIFITSLISIS